MTQSTATIHRDGSLVRMAKLMEHILLRYGLALVLLWIGGMKFTSYEAHGIMGLEANSPFMRPLLAALGAQGLANLLGVSIRASGSSPVPSQSSCS